MSRVFLLIMSIFILKPSDESISTSNYRPRGRKAFAATTSNPYASLTETDGGLGETANREIEDLEPKRRRKKTTELVSELTRFYEKLKLCNTKQSDQQLQDLKKTSIIQQVYLRPLIHRERIESGVEDHPSDFIDSLYDLLVMEASDALQIYSSNHHATLSFVVKSNTQYESFLGPKDKFMQSLALQRSVKTKSKQISPYEVNPANKTRKSKQADVLRPPRKSHFLKTNIFESTRHQYVNKQQGGFPNLVIEDI